jgi:pSer/pThr/pTyr-binding forkhead associated (FHA) protein
VKLNVLKNNTLIENLDLEQLVDSVDDQLEFYLGRSDSCAVKLDDASVSREHAKFIISNGWKIVNSSEHGQLLVNNNQVSESNLRPGDIIVIGPFSIIVLDTSSAPSSEKSDNDQEDSENEDGSEISDDFSEKEETLDGEVTETESYSEDSDFGDQSDDNESSDYDSNEYENNEYENNEYENNEYSSDNESGNEYDNDDNEYANDEYGGDESGGFSDDPLDSGELIEDSDKTNVFRTFAKFELELIGEYAPYDSFIIDKDEVLIGRDPNECDIVVDDIEVSTQHAKIIRNNITCVLEDLKSSNGTILNGVKINKATLTNNDEFIIGSTTFTMKIGSDLLAQEDRFMPVAENQVVEVEEVIEISPDDADLEDDDYEGEAESGSKSLFSKEALKDPEKRKKLLIYAVLLMGLWMFLGEEEAEKKQDPKGKANNNRLVKEKKEAKVVTENGKKRKLTEEEMELLNSSYLIAQDLLWNGKFQEATLIFPTFSIMISTGFPKALYLKARVLFLSLSLL